MRLGVGTTQPHSPQHGEARRELAGRGTDSRESRKLAMLRIFGCNSGQYGTGVRAMADASHQWSKRAEIAEQYLNRMSYALLHRRLVAARVRVFQRQLRGVQGVIHGRSSNLYGIMDLTENFEYQGTLALAVEQLDGKQPALYVNDLVHGQRCSAAARRWCWSFSAAITTRSFIKSMKAEGYDGARYFSRIADNQFGWDLVSNVITAETGRSRPRSTWTTSTGLVCTNSSTSTIRTPCKTSLPASWKRIARDCTSSTTRPWSWLPASTWKRSRNTVRPVPPTFSPTPSWPRLPRSSPARPISLPTAPWSSSEAN